MENKDKPGLSSEDWASKKYSKMFGRPIAYTIVVTRYKEGPDGKREIIMDDKLCPPKSKE